jgi:ribonucleoside-diphosphate reductase alpha chain
MGITFIQGFREANGPTRQPDLPMPGLLEEQKKRVNRPVPELPIAEDTDIVVKASVRPGDSNGAKNGNSHARTVHSLSDAIAHFQSDAPTCPSCGHVAVRNGACYKCLNCGESLGCS